MDKKTKQEAKGVKKSRMTQEQKDSDEKKASTPETKRAYEVRSARPEDLKDTSMQFVLGLNKTKRTPVTYLTEEDYKKYNYWSVGTFHRASTSPVTDQSGGEEGES